MGFSQVAHRPQYTLHVFLMMGTPKKEPPILVSPYVLRWGLSPAQQAGDFGVRACQRSPSSRCLLVLSREYGICYTGITLRLSLLRTSKATFAMLRQTSHLDTIRPESQTMTAMERRNSRQHIGHLCRHFEKPPRMKIAPILYPQQRSSPIQGVRAISNMHQYLVL